MISNYKYQLNILIVSTSDILYQRWAILSSCNVCVQLQLLHSDEDDIRGVCMHHAFLIHPNFYSFNKVVVVK